MWATALIFRRTRLSDFEDGIGIGRRPGEEGFELIVDKEYRVIDEPYSWIVQSFRGSFVLTDE